MQPAPGLLVVVADDDANLRFSMRDVLSIMGHRAYLACDGPGAVDAVAQLCPDAALVDLSLPGFDGFEVARRVRALPGGDEMLLIAYSGWDSPEDIDRSREAGFDRHLVKPVAPQVLEELLLQRAARLARQAQ